MSYRKIWEQTYGPIPTGYEIHHIDGNRKNNNISNLICVTTEQHYEIHYRQGDYLACALMSDRIGLTPEQKKEIHRKAMTTRDQTGEKNPMYGRSAIKENNMKWYNDGINESMFVEGRQPADWKNGRIFFPEYDKSGSNNPRARKVRINNKIYNCIKDAAADLQMNYSTLKGIVNRGYSKKFNIKAEYIC